MERGRIHPDDTRFRAEFIVEDLADLYLQNGRDLDSVLMFIDLSLSRAFVSAELLRRTARFPRGQEVGRAILDCLLAGDNPSLRRLKRALRVDWIRGRHPNPLEAKEEGKDLQAVAMMKAWQLTERAWAKVRETPAERVRLPRPYEVPELDGRWQDIAETLRPQVRPALEWFLPILRGEAENYPRKAYQAIRDYWWKQAAQKRGGSGPLEIPIDPECPYCHRGIGKPSRPLNSDPRIGRLWPFVCDHPPCDGVTCSRPTCLHGRCGKCGVAFDGRPDKRKPTVSWEDFMIEQTSRQPRTWEESLLGHESLSPSHLMDTWGEGLTINRNEPEPDAEPAMKLGLDAEEACDPDPATWTEMSREERIEEVYRLALQLFGERGPRLLDAYQKHGNAVGAGRALGFSRKTCHAWFRRLKEGTLAAHA